MDRTTFEQAKEIVERIERGKSLMEQLSKSAKLLSNNDNEGLSDFIAAFNEISEGKWLMEQIMHEIMLRCREQLRELEEQLKSL